MENITVREMQKNEIPLMVDYFLEADLDFHKKMGVDTANLPKRSDWIASLEKEFEKEIKDRKYFYVIWLIDDMPCGHSNINDIIFGEKGDMHLHLWKSDRRQKGLGSQFVKLGLVEFFEKFNLKQVFCEPSAYNEASNNTLEKVGFEFVKEYDTKPSRLALFQTVKRWVIGRKKIFEVNIL